MENTNDIYNELATNFIEYAAAVNSDRAIPDAKSGLKPVARRIIYCANEQGFNSSKPHVKCANMVGLTMANYHPHGDSSIYEALVRLSQPWVMRYPLIDFHGSNGNMDGDGPAASRYTEARLSKIAEKGLLEGIKKNNVDFISNYSETTLEPVTLPAIFPNLLCNPNTGIGVSMACNYLPHNLREVASAINDYIAGKEPMLPGPDFPTGGIVVNKNDIPNIMRTGIGSVIVRGKYEFDGNNIIFTEIPYGINTESLMEEIGKVCDDGKIMNIVNIRNESNKNGFRLVIECAKDASLNTIIKLLFKETSLETSISYNQVALVDKVPTELNLKDAIKVYVDHNTECIIRESDFDIKKTSDRLHIVEGLIKALSNVDDIITDIKSSNSATDAKDTLMTKWLFSEEQAKSILDMKLSRLAKLEEKELLDEKTELNKTLITLQGIHDNPIKELKKRLANLVKEFGDDRRTEIIQLDEEAEENDETELIEPEKCIVIMFGDGSIKRISTELFKPQKRNGKGNTTPGDIVIDTIRTNTVDSLMVFTNKGKMYRIIVNDIPVGTNASKGISIRTLISMEPDEKPAIIYSIYHNTTAKYVMFATKLGLIKRVPVEEYKNVRKRCGIVATKLKKDDAIISISLMEDEDVIYLTKKGMCVRASSANISIMSKGTTGSKGITLNSGDEVISVIPVRNETDDFMMFYENGRAKRIKSSEIPVSKGRSPKGLKLGKCNSKTGDMADSILVEDSDMIYIAGTPCSICFKASEVSTVSSKGSATTPVINGSIIESVTKI